MPDSPGEVMGKIELFAVGGSAGGLEALRTLTMKLPRDFQAAVCVVLHMAPDSPGLIPEILSSAGALPAQHPHDGEIASGGRIYVAPPDQHLIVDKERRLRLGRGPRENRFRPAIDPLFRSAALALDGRAAGVILSGGLDDGAAGAVAIKQRGGAVIVQDPSDADVPSMPTAVIKAVRPDRQLPASQIAEAMTEFAESYVSHAHKERLMSGDLEREISFAMGADRDLAGVTALGDPSMFTCPECHGALVRLRDTVPLRFRCHTGHAFTLESLASAQHEHVENSLWSAIRALEEQAGLLEHFAQHFPDAEQRRAEILHEAEEAQWRSRLVRDAVRSER